MGMHQLPPPLLRALFRECPHPGALPYTTEVGTHLLFTVAFQFCESF